jgi:predicted O-methyltransferase YrrM
MTTDLSTLADLEGLITEDIGRTLYDFARDVPDDQAIVELGSYKGASACYLAAGSRDGFGPSVYAVDAWDPQVTAWCHWLRPAAFEEFEKQLRSKRLWSRVTPVRGLTAEAAETYAGKPVGLLFIDADHCEQAALADFRAWRPHLATDAYVIFDDYDTPQNPGVKAAVAKLHAAGEIKAVGVRAKRLAVCGLE